LNKILARRLAPLSLLIICWLASPPSAAARPTTRVESPILRLTTSIKDLHRKKEVRLHVLCPRLGAHLPCVVFSPEAGIDAAVYDALTEYWAAKGLVVIIPEHDDSPANLKHSGHSLDTVDIAVLEQTTPQLWIDRVADIELLLDEVAILWRHLPPLKDKIDPRRVGLAGDRVGALAAMLLEGATTKGVPPLGDERPRAFLLLCAPGAGVYGLTKSSFDGLKRPTLVASGGRDFWHDELPDWHLMAFWGGPARGKWALTLLRAGLTDWFKAGASFMPSLNESEMAAMKNLQIVTTTFWDAQLAGAAEAQKKLSNGQLERDGAGSIRFYVRQEPRNARKHVDEALRYQLAL
jgi:hypothetical protein